MTNDFYNKVAEETNKCAALLQRKAGTVDNNWDDTNAEEIQAYIGILIYMCLVDLPETGLFSRRFLRLSYSETSHDIKTIQKAGTIFTSE